MNLIATLSHDPSHTFIIGITLLIFGWIGNYVKIFSGITGLKSRSMVLDLLVIVGIIMMLASIFFMALSAQ